MKEKKEAFFVSQDFQQDLQTYYNIHTSTVALQNNPQYVSIFQLPPPGNTTSDSSTKLDSEVPSKNSSVLFSISNVNPFITSVSSNPIPTISTPASTSSTTNTSNAPTPISTSSSSATTNQENPPASSASESQQKKRKRVSVADPQQKLQKVALHLMNKLNQ